MLYKLLMFILLIPIFSIAAYSNTCEWAYTPETNFQTSNWCPNYNAINPEPPSGSCSPGGSTCNFPLPDMYGNGMNAVFECVCGGDQSGADCPEDQVLGIHGCVDIDLGDGNDPSPNPGSCEGASKQFLYSSDSPEGLVYDPDVCACGQKYYYETSGCSCRDNNDPDNDLLATICRISFTPGMPICDVGYTADYRTSYQIYECRAACTPDCSGANQVCSGETFDDGCGGVCQGTKEDSSWSPARNTVCQGEIFTQSGDCSGTREVTGTKTTGVCAPDPVCTPDCSGANQVCSGETFGDGCGGVCQGTKEDSSWSPARNTVCSGTTFTQTGQACDQTREVTGTKTTGVCAPDPVCTPDCSNANNVCQGIEFDDGCDGVCTGTKTTGNCASDPVCTPDCSSSSQVCQGTEFGDGCGGVCQGTKTGGSCIQGIDIGLKIFDGNSNVPIQVEPLGTMTSPLRVQTQAGKVGIILVDINDPDALPIRIQTSSGLKALKKHSVCTPDCSDASFICSGIQYPDGCGGVCTGTKEDSIWTPDPSNFCSGESVDQVGDCGGTRTVPGTKTVDECATCNPSCESRSSVDTDNGRDPDQKGSVTDFLDCYWGECRTDTYTDYCANSNSVVEYEASGTSYSSSTISCGTDGHFCSGDNRMFRDFTCANGACTSSSNLVETCEYGCTGGICNEPTCDPSCETRPSTDSDSGSNKNVRGTVTDFLTCDGGDCTTNTYTDYCANSNSVVEYTASGTGYSSSTISCGTDTYFCSGNNRKLRDYSCSGGRCSYSDSTVETCEYGCSGTTCNAPTCEWVLTGGYGEWGGASNENECRALDEDLSSCPNNPNEGETCQIESNGNWYDNERDCYVTIREYEYQCGTPTSCTDSSWSPARNTVCSGDSFTQVSNCGRERTKTGTKTDGLCSAGYCEYNGNIYENGDMIPGTRSSQICSNGEATDSNKFCCNSNIITSYSEICGQFQSNHGCSGTTSCVDTVWSPNRNTVCSGQSFTQESNCGRERTRSGTKTDTSWSPSPSTVCSGSTFTQTGQTCDQTRTSVGTKTTGVCATCSPACSTRPSIDSDSGSNKNVRGTVTDFLSCSSGSCTTNTYTDYCANSNSVVEYRATGSSFSSSTLSCGTDTYFCSGNNRKLRDYSCSGGRCSYSDSTVETCEYGCSGTTCNAPTCTYQFSERLNYIPNGAINLGEEVSNPGGTCTCGNTYYSEFTYCSCVGNSGNYRQGYSVICTQEGTCNPGYRFTINTDYVIFSCGTGDSRACQPDCSGANQVCSGRTFDDGCGGSCTGTKSDSDWSPRRNTVCSGTSFTQTSDCGNTRTRTGTKTWGSCATCTPDCSNDANVCLGDSYSDGCGGTCYGTKIGGSCGTQFNADLVDPTPEPCEENNRLGINGCTDQGLFG